MHQLQNTVAISSLSVGMINLISPCFLFLCPEESEKAIVKMKNLDESVPVPVKRKDVNTFQNNQVKFPAGASSIPPENMKCNILKAKLEEEHQKGLSVIISNKIKFCV